MEQCVCFPLGGDQIPTILSFFPECRISCWLEVVGGVWSVLIAEKLVRCWSIKIILGGIGRASSDPQVTCFSLEHSFWK